MNNISTKLLLDSEMTGDFSINTVAAKPGRGSGHAPISKTAHFEIKKFKIDSPTFRPRPGSPTLK